MMTLIFDKTNFNWRDDKEYNLLFISMEQEYLDYKLNGYGYLYENQIYESLGITWDPSKENKLYTKEDYRHIILHQTHVRAGDTYTGTVIIDVEFRKHFN